MSSLLIKNAEVITKDKLLKDYSVYCIDGKIVQVMPTKDGEELFADEIVDASGLYLAPGYIDLHIHGTKGLLIDEGKGKLEKLCKVLPEYGVTGFLPTVCPMPSEADDIELLSSLAEAKGEGTSILGFFLEGHYLALTGAFSKLPEDEICVKTVENHLKALAPHKVVFGI